MKSQFKLILTTCLIASVTLFEACKNDDVAPTQQGTAKNAKPTLTGDYQLYNLSGTASGTARFSKRSDNSTVITIQMTGAPGTHPAHIHDAKDNIVIDLTDVAGDGSSSTVVDATTMTYEKLIVLKGYIAVHISSTNFGFVATANIG